MNPLYDIKPHEPFPTKHPPSLADLQRKNGRGPPGAPVAPSSDYKAIEQHFQKHADGTPNWHEPILLPTTPLSQLQANNRPRSNGSVKNPRALGKTATDTSGPSGTLGIQVHLLRTAPWSFRPNFLKGRTLSGRLKGHCRLSTCKSLNLGVPLLLKLGTRTQVNEDQVTKGHTRSGETSKEGMGCDVWEVHGEQIAEDDMLDSGETCHSGVEYIPSHGGLFPFHL